MTTDTAETHYVCRLCDATETSAFAELARAIDARIGELEPALLPRASVAALGPLPAGWIFFTSPSSDVRFICRACYALLVNSDAAELVASLRDELETLKRSLKTPPSPPPSLVIEDDKKQPVEPPAALKELAAKAWAELEMPPAREESGG